MLDGSVKRYLSYEELKNIDPEKALGIDLTKKEYHLNGNFPKACRRDVIYIFYSLKKKLNLEAEFEPVFGISKESYDALPQWKKDKLKRSVGLF